MKERLNYPGNLNNCKKKLENRKNSEVIWPMAIFPFLSHDEFIIHLLYGRILLKLQLLERNYHRVIPIPD